MIGRIVEISQDRRHLAQERGFLVVHASHTEGGEEIGRVPLDDIAAVIVSAHGITHSSNLLVALAERGAPFVLTDRRMNPAALLWPLEGNYEQAGRMDAQIEAGKPLNKRLWQQIVRSKLSMQAAALEAVGAPFIPLRALVDKVRSGDPDNLEAQGARRYWGLLFGEDFRRNREADGINALLNYGYMVLRAATARAIIAAGLHPSLGLHHCNTQNALRLVDDLMEPFRPIVDLQTLGLSRGGRLEVDKTSKQALAQLMYIDLPVSIGLTPLMGCLQRLATSLAQVYLGERKELELPLLPSPLELAGLAAPFGPPQDTDDF